MHTQDGEVRQSPQGITAVISMDSMLFGPPGHCFDVVSPAWVSQIQPNLTHRSHLCLTPTQHLSKAFPGTTFHFKPSSWPKAGIVLLEMIHLGSAKTGRNCGEGALTVGRLVWFHTLSFHNGHVVNGNVPFDSRATDPFKDELGKGRAEGGKLKTSSRADWDE